MLLTSLPLPMSLIADPLPEHLMIAHEEPRQQLSDALTITTTATVLVVHGLIALTLQVTLG